MYLLSSTFFFFLHGTYHIVIKLKTLHPLTPDPKFSEVMEKELNTLRIQNLQKSTKEAVAQLKYSSKIPTNLWALGKTNWWHITKFMQWKGTWAAQNDHRMLQRNFCQKVFFNYRLKFKVKKENTSEGQHWANQNSRLRQLRILEIK